MEQMAQERKGKEHVYGDMPLYVLAAGRASSDSERLRQVNDMALMSTNSLLLLDPKSVHDMHIDVPSLVTQSVKCCRVGAHGNSAGRRDVTLSRPVADKNTNRLTRKMVNDALRARGRDESLYTARQSRNQR